MPLTAVRRPADVVQRWGAYQIDAAHDTSRYEDDLVEIGVRAIDGTFVLTVRNKTDQSLEVPWDGMVYVNSRGTSSGVVNHEVADATMDIRTRQVPTTIATRATAILTAVPWMNLQAGGTITDFVPTETATPALNGSEVRLVIPLIWEGVVNEYTFVFRLSDVRRVTFQTGSRCKLASCTIDQAKQVLLEEQLATVVAGDSVTVLGHGALARARANAQGRLVARLPSGTRLLIDEVVNDTWLRTSWRDSTVYVRTSEVARHISGRNRNAVPHGSRTMPSADIS